MKRISMILLTLILLIVSVDSAKAAYAIVNYKQGAGTAEDTLTVIGFNSSATDGNIVGFDSIYVRILNPKGDSVFADSSNVTNFSSHGMAQFTSGGRPFVRLTKAVSTLIGVNKMIGTYTGVLIVVDTLDGTSAEYQDLAVPFQFSVNPTTLGFENMNRKYFYNTTYPWIVDSCVYYVEELVNPAMVVHYKALGTTKPDTVGVAVP